MKKPDVAILLSALSLAISVTALILTLSPSERDAEQKAEKERYMKWSDPTGRGPAPLNYKDPPRPDNKPEENP